MNDVSPMVKIYRTHKAAITRAKGRGDHDQVVAIAQSALARFEVVGYHDDWAWFQRAADDAQTAKRLADRSWPF